MTAAQKEPFLYERNRQHPRANRRPDRLCARTSIFEEFVEVVKLIPPEHISE